MGLTPSRWQLYFTSASAVAVVNSVVGGAALAIACWVAFDASLGTAAVVGCVFAIVSVTAHEYWLRRRLERGVAADVLFPSPPPSPAVVTLRTTLETRRTTRRRSARASGSPGVRGPTALQATVTGDPRTPDTNTRPTTYPLPTLTGGRA